MQKKKNLVRVQFHMFKSSCPLLPWLLPKNKIKVADHSCVLICTGIYWTTYGGLPAWSVWQKITRRISWPTLKSVCSSDLCQLVNSIYTSHRLSFFPDVSFVTWPWGTVFCWFNCSAHTSCRAAKVLQGRGRCIWLLFQSSTRKIHLQGQRRESSLAAVKWGFPLLYYSTRS